MLTFSLKDAKTRFSSLVNEAIKGEFMTITRHGKPVVALVSIDIAETARKAMGPGRTRLAAYLRTFPDGDTFEHNHTQSRDMEL